MSGKNKNVPQIALFSSSNKDKLEAFINDNLASIHKNGYEYKETRIWTTTRDNGSIVWNGIIEYLISDNEELERKIENEARLIRLRDFNYDPTLSLSTVGLIGCQALIVQNNLDISIDESYGSIMDLIEEKYSFDRETPLNEFSVNVEQINVQIKIDENQ